MREVCSDLGVSRSHVTTRLHRRADWIDARKAAPVADDEQLISDLVAAVRDRASYCYRRIWAVLRHQGVDGRKYSHQSGKPIDQQKNKTNSAQNLFACFLSKVTNKFHIL